MFNLIENEPLARYTSWKIGGPARYFAELTTPDQLRAALAWAQASELPTFLLGGGSNTLVYDAGFAGLVLRYRNQELELTITGDSALARLGAGAPTAGSARRLTRQGWAGLAWAEGVPGVIGGAVYGNAGCYGGDIASSLTRAWLLVDGTIEEWPVARFGYGYRTSVLKQPGVRGQGPGVRGQPNVGDQEPLIPDPRSLTPLILAAEFALIRGDIAALGAQIEQTAALRRSKTPAGQSCGSVFKNPPGDSAGRLIEAAGLKGSRSGGAAIAEKHANYILNLGQASSDDVLRLIELARTAVLQQFGVELELEVGILA